MVLEQGRKLLVAHQFNNEPYRILLASLSSGLTQAEHFINNTFQKFLLREIRIAIAAVKGDVWWNKPGRRYVMHMSSRNEEGDNDVDQVEEASGEANDEADKQDIPKRPSKINPLVTIVHGQTLTASKSYQSALCQYHLIFVLAFTNIHHLILASSPSTRIRQLTGRSTAIHEFGSGQPGACYAEAGGQSELSSNPSSLSQRNYALGIIDSEQSFAFLSRYRSLRGEENSDKFHDEIEYNFGRAFHQLGAC